MLPNSAGDEIPIAAQVVALADVYDALTSERCYKQAYSHEKAVDMILHGECGSFNPLLMECLKESSELLRTELQRSEYDRGFRHETRRLSEEILHREALPREDRAQRLLDLERERTAFYAGAARRYPVRLRYPQRQRDRGEPLRGPGQPNPEAGL